VRLVGEARLGRGPGRRDARGQQPARRLDAQLALVVAGREPVGLGEGTVGLELFRQPVVVYAADAGTLSQAHQRALAWGLPLAIYTMDMFRTGNDDGNRAVVRAVPAAELSFAGLAVYGPRNAVDKIFKGASLHP
jgi:hypothetical protein